MSKVLESKIEEYKKELDNQVFTAQDKAEIEKIVEDYRKELTSEKENEYAYNRAIIEAKIEALDEANRLEKLEEETQEPTPATLTVSI